MTFLRLSQHAGLRVEELKRAGFTPREFLDAGCGFQLRQAEFNIQELTAAGLTPEQLLEARLASQLLPAGFSMQQLVASRLTAAGSNRYGKGYTPQEFLDAGCRTKGLIDAGWTFQQLAQAGLALPVLVDCGKFTIQQFEKAGFAPQLAVAHWLPGSSACEIGMDTAAISEYWAYCCRVEECGAQTTAALGRQICVETSAGIWVFATEARAGRDKPETASGCSVYRRAAEKPEVFTVK